MSAEPDTTPRRLTLVDMVMGVGVALTWGLGIVFAKAAIAHFPPILLMGFRFTLTALVLVWFVTNAAWAADGALPVSRSISAALQYSHDHIRASRGWMPA